MKLIHNASRRVLVLALMLTLANAVHAFRPWMLEIPYITLMNMLGGMVLALEGLLLCKRVGRQAAAPSESPPPRPLVERDERARHELAAFLGLLQEKGRLVDFLMEDITQQPDARVGQVARVVHQGCAGVLKKHFDLTPLAPVREGESLSLPEDHKPGDYRLVGTGSGEAPLKGRVLHPGWKTGKVTLPEITRDIPASTDCYVVAPVELELN